MAQTFNAELTATSSKLINLYKQSLGELENIMSDETMTTKERLSAISAIGKFLRQAVDMNKNEIPEVEVLWCVVF